jgi:hypothetical protein
MSTWQRSRQWGVIYGSCVSYVADTRAMNGRQFLLSYVSTYQNKIMYVACFLCKYLVCGNNRSYSYRKTPSLTTVYAPDEKRSAGSSDLQYLTANEKFTTHKNFTHWWFNNRSIHRNSDPEITRLRSYKLQKHSTRSKFSTRQSLFPIAHRLQCKTQSSLLHVACVHCCPIFLDCLRQNVGGNHYSPTRGRAV